MIPHPDKAAKGGEDYYFIADDGRTVGVADGVGGWANVPGADAARYSRDLMTFSKSLCHLGGPRAIMEAAYAKLDLTVRGSTTALIAQLRDDRMHVCNVGDSALAIFRGGRMLFRTRDTVFGFNFPFQLGYRGKVLPKDGTYDAVKIVPGDVVLLGTDGLWDNVWMQAIEKRVAQRVATDDRKFVEALARDLAESAHENGKDQEFWSPFAREAAKAGHRFKGGKLDDVTVVASLIIK
jgi:protein phosphatase PTC7